MLNIIVDQTLNVNLKNVKCKCTNINYICRKVKCKCGKVTCVYVKRNLTIAVLIISAMSWKCLRCTINTT